jgi:hypothetical protein
MVEDCHISVQLFIGIEQFPAVRSLMVSMESRPESSDLDCMGVVLMAQKISLNLAQSSGLESVCYVMDS